MIEYIIGPEPTSFDKAHRDKLAAAIVTTVYETSVIEKDGERTIHVRTNELIDAFSLVLATMFAHHEYVITPRDRRMLAQDIAKKLFSRLDVARKVVTPYLGERH